VAIPSTQDLLIFVGVPLATVVIVFALVYASPGGRGTKRYRPGRPYPYAPVWFLARPEKDGPAGRAALGPGHGNGPGRASEHAELPSSGSDDVLTASDASVAPAASVGATVAAREHPGVTGGASDRW